MRNNINKFDKKDYIKIKNNFRLKLKKLFFFGFLSLIIIYLIFSLYNYIIGPLIIINSPKPYQIINTKTFELIGQVKNSKSIYINGREIQITENGNFEETQITKSPYTIITIKAVDRYGKATQKILTYGVSQDIN